MAFPKALLHGMHLAIAGESFDRGHFCAIGLNSEDGARLDCFAIEQHSARAADGRFTPDVCARQATDISQEMHEEHARLDFVLLESSIDADVYDSFGRCRLHVVVLMRNGF
jgi:hypothetical protein